MRLNGLKHIWQIAISSLPHFSSIRLAGQQPCPAFFMRGGPPLLARRNSPAGKPALTGGANLRPNQTSRDALCRRFRVSQCAGGGNHLPGALLIWGSVVGWRRRRQIGTGLSQSPNWQINRRRVPLPMLLNPANFHIAHLVK